MHLDLLSAVWEDSFYFHKKKIKILILTLSFLSAKIGRSLFYPPYPPENGLSTLGIAGWIKKVSCIPPCCREIFCSFSLFPQKKSHFLEKNFNL